jgi:zona occludens toxin (predicted ATPase)
LVDKKMKENFHRIYSYCTTDSTEKMKRGRSLWKNSHAPLVDLLLLVCFSTVYHKHTDQFFFFENECCRYKQAQTFEIEYSKTQKFKEISALTLFCIIYY